MDDDNFFPGLVVGCIISATVMIVVSIFSDNTWRKEAVEKGHAHWVVSSDGKTKFEWNEVKK